MIQELDETKLEAFTNQVLNDLAASYGSVMTSIGDRLGLFDALAALVPAFNVPASMWLDEEQAIEAFRTGAGVPWGDHHARLHDGVASFYRNAYGAALVPEWLPALDGVVAKLQEGAKVADVGCGHGHSTLLMAEAFPNSSFYGYDSHPASIAAAR
jgi:SAM-dependent methyltransferase